MQIICDFYSASQIIFGIDVIEEPGGKCIRMMKIKVQEKILKTGIFVSKRLLRSKVSLLKTQHHQKMRHTMRQSLKYHYIAN